MAITRASAVSIWDLSLVRPALVDALWKLNPLTMARNPVMFVVEVGAVLVSGRFAIDVLTGRGDLLFEGQIVAWLWLTVLFANFAEAIAEGRGKAPADSLRRSKTDTLANRVVMGDAVERVPAARIVRGDVVLVAAGEVVPGDGEIVEGVASVDESAITGESAPVIREAGGDRSAVTGGTRVLSDWIKVRITANPGETFLDRMIGLKALPVRRHPTRSRSAFCSPVSPSSSSWRSSPCSRWRCTPGKQLLMTRGALTTFSIANDVAKYFAIIPAMFLATFPALNALNIMGLRTPQSAILSAVIFNALIIVVLVPLALRGITYRPQSAAALLRRNLLLYGLGGLIAPFIGIKLIDVVITTIGPG